MPVVTNSVAAPAIPAGPVVIPQFDTLKEMSEHASALEHSSGAPPEEKRDTTPFPVLIAESAAAVLAGRANGSYGPVESPRSRRAAAHAATWHRRVVAGQCMAVAPQPGSVHPLARTGPDALSERGGSLPGQREQAGFMNLIAGRKRLGDSWRA
jgi:hypothetical protein